MLFLVLSDAVGPEGHDPRFDARYVVYGLYALFLEHLHHLRVVEEGTEGVDPFLARLPLL